jgi:hypothetical protein
MYQTKPAESWLTGPIAQLGERGTEDIQLPRSGVRSTFGPSFLHTNKIQCFCLSKGDLAETASDVEMGAFKLRAIYTPQTSGFAVALVVEWLTYSLRVKYWT